MSFQLHFPFFPSFLASTQTTQGIPLFVVEAVRNHKFNRKLNFSPIPKNEDPEMHNVKHVETGVWSTDYTPTLTMNIYNCQKSILL